MLHFPRSIADPLHAEGIHKPGDPAPPMGRIENNAVTEKESVPAVLRPHSYLCHPSGSLR